MHSASSPSSSDSREISLRRRIVPFLLTVLAHLLLLLMLLRLSPAFAPMGHQSNHLTTVDLGPGEQPAPPQAHQAAKVRHASSGAAPSVVVPPAPPPPVPPKTPPLPPVDLIPVTREDMAQLSTAMQTSHAMGHQGASNGPAATGNESGADSEVVGTAPGGGNLYAAEWYRHPTDAEMNFYIHKAPPDGAWAEIACRTVERYHVEDCEELGDGPHGLGLARGIQQAAWQFLVRPPRVGGHTLVGSWVRIRIDFIDKPNAAER